MKRENTLFEEAYRLAKQHAYMFGWSRTNADIRLVANAHSATPCLGGLSSEQQEELIRKWTLDISGQGHPPSVEYAKVKEICDRYKKRFGPQALSLALLKHGGSSWATNIRQSLRQTVIDALEADIAADIARARKVAGKSPKAGSGGFNFVVDISQAKEQLAKADDQIKAFLREPDRRSRIRGHGPYRAAVPVDGRYTDVNLRFNTHVRVREDGKWGRVTRIDCDTEGEECRAIVLLMDDLTTRVLRHEENAAALLDNFTYYDGGKTAKIGRFKFCTYNRYLFDILGDAP